MHEQIKHYQTFSAQVLGDMIRKKRKELGLSQREMCIKIGVSLNSYQKWEHGITKPNFEHLMILIQNNIL